MDKQPSISKLNLFTLVTLGLFIAACLAGYSRIESSIAVNQQRQLEVEQNINRVVFENKKQFELLQKQISRLGSQDSLEASSEQNLSADVDLMKFIQHQHGLIKELKQQTEQIKEQMGMRSVAEQPMLDQDEGVMAAGAMDMEIQIAQSEEESRRSIEEHYTQVESTFQEQSENASWSSDVNQKFGSAIEELQTTMEFDKSNVENIDCRTSQCKLQVFHSAGSEDPEMFKMELSALMAADFPGSTSKIQQNEDGSVMATYYFFKNR